MGGHHGYPAMRRFEEQYHVYSVAFADKAHLEVRLAAGSFPTSRGVGLG